MSNSPTPHSDNDQQDLLPTWFELDKDIEISSIRSYQEFLKVQQPQTSVQVLFQEKLDMARQFVKRYGAILSLTTVSVSVVVLLSVLTLNKPSSHIADPDSNSSSQETTQEIALDRCAFGQGCSSIGDSSLISGSELSQVPSSSSTQSLVSSQTKSSSKSSSTQSIPASRSSSSPKTNSQASSCQNVSGKVICTANGSAIAISSAPPISSSKSSIVPDKTYTAMVKDDEGGKVVFTYNTGTKKLTYDGGYPGNVCWKIDEVKWSFFQYHKTKILLGYILSANPNPGASCAAYPRYLPFSGEVAYEIDPKYLDDFQNLFVIQREI